MVDKYKQRIIFGVGGVVLVVVIAAAAFLIPSLIDLAPTNSIGSPELALAQRMNRQQPKITVLRVDITQDGELLEVILLDLDPDGSWTEFEQNNMVKAVWMAMEFAADRELSMNLTHWRELTAINVADQQQVEIYLATSFMICGRSALLEIDFTEAATATAIFESCSAFPDGSIIASLAVDLWTR